DSCTREKDCVRNAECGEESKKCVCKRGYSETSSKGCGLSYAQSCGGQTNQEEQEGGNNNNFVCSDIYYACINGECRCKNPSYEIYDNETESCLSLVGGLCHFFLPSNN